VCCSVLQCISVLQCVAVCCSVVYCVVLQCIGIYRRLLGYLMGLLVLCAQLFCFNCIMNWEISDPGHPSIGLPKLPALTVTILLSLFMLLDLLSYMILPLYVHMVCCFLCCCFCVRASIWCNRCIKFDLSDLSSNLFLLAQPVCGTYQFSGTPRVGKIYKELCSRSCRTHTHVWRLDCMRITVHKVGCWLESRGQIQRLNRNNS